MNPVKDAMPEELWLDPEYGCARVYVSKLEGGVKYTRARPQNPDTPESRAALEWFEKASAKYEYDNFLKHPEVFGHIKTIRAALTHPPKPVDVEALKREVWDACFDTGTGMVSYADAIDHLAANYEITEKRK